MKGASGLANILNSKFRLLEYAYKSNFANITTRMTVYFNGINIWDKYGYSSVSLAFSL